MVLFKNTLTGVLCFFIAILTPIALFSQPLQVKIDLKLDVSCFGGADGAIFLVAEQGTPPYFFEWNTGESSASLVNLSPGVYTCTVTDSGGDSEVVNVQITQPSAPIQVQADSLRRPDCINQKGYIRAMALGGTPPYQYEWSNGSANPAIDDIPVGYSGNYSVTVTDANGCTGAGQFDASAFRPPTPQFGAIPVLSCGVSTVTIAPVNPSPLYLPFWTASNGGNIISSPDSFQITVNATGDYRLTYTLAANGCTRQLDIQVGFDSIPPIVNAGPDQNWLCSNDGGTLNGTVNASGNPVSGFWRAFDGGKFFEQGQELDTTSNFSPTATRTGLYVFTGINNTTGCFASDTLLITSNTPAPAVSVQSSFFSCVRDTIQLTAQFDTLNRRLDGWTGPNGFASTEKSPRVTLPGNYTVSVTDTLTGCTGRAILTLGIDTTAPPLILPAGPNQLSCQNPVLPVTANSDTLYNQAPFVYRWTGPAGFDTTARSVLIFIPGLYAVSVTNTVNGCVTSGNLPVTADSTFLIAEAGPDTVLTCTNPAVALDGAGSSQGLTYTWTTANGNIVSGANTLTPVVDAPGTYLLEVFNPAGGCQAADEVIVTADQTPPTATATGGTLTCAVTNLAINGVVQPANAQFSWSGPNNFSANVLQPIVQTPGSYTLLAVLANGCTASATATVSADTVAPVLSVNNDTLTCAANTAELTASATGDQLSFSWSGPNGFSASTPSVQVIQTGDYTVTVQNGLNGCTAVATGNVLLDAVLPEANAGADDFLNCNVSILKLNGSGSSLGSGIVYQWTTPDGNIISGETSLSPRVDESGIYILTVLNETTGCSAKDTVVIVQRDPVTVSAQNLQNVACFGSGGGVAIASASGGTGLYQFGWSNGAQSSTVSGLVAGVYTVLAIDSEGCVATAFVTIAQPDRLEANVSSTPETFGGQNDGTATAVPTGGVAPYDIAWSNNETSPTITNLAPGAYTVTITDANGCTVVESVTVNASNCFLSATVAVSDLTCAGANNGSATLTVSNAPAPVSFNWSNGGTQNAIQDVPAGIYSVTITDANSCSIVRTVTINTPLALVANIVAKENVVCADDAEGLLAASASGGTQPYNYTWSNGSTQSVAENLAVGNYTVTVVDGRGCSQILSGSITATDTLPPVVFVTDFLISLDENGEVQLEPENFVVAALDIECEIASMVVEPATFGCGDVGFHIVNIIATDLNGNVTIKPADLVIVDNAFPILNCPANLTVGLCDAFITYPAPTVTDNCPVDQNLIVRTSGLPSGTLFPVGTTLQTYTYTDNAGNVGLCNFTFTVLGLPEIVETVAPAACSNDCDGQVNLNISGDAQPYSIEWSNGATDANLSDLCPGVYGYTITDGADCKTVYSLTVAAVDDEFPVLQLQTAAAFLDANGQVQVDPLIFNNGSSDNCGIASWAVSPNTFNCSQIGTQTVTVTATDDGGNTSSKTVQVVIADNRPPDLTCPPSLIVGACDNVVTFNLPTFADNCSAAPTNLALISGLASGSVFPVGTTVQVFQATDASTNQNTCAFTVTVSGAPTLTPGIQPVTCFGGCDGAVNLTISGGNTPLSFLWNTGQTTASVSGICAGPATITITDADGCQTVRTFLVSQPDPIFVFVDSIAKDAGGAGIGAIQITVSGGTPPYGYLWTRSGAPISTSEDPTGLKKGYYKVSVTDANGCGFFRDSIYLDDIIGVQEPLWANGLVLAPNPATDRVQLIFPTAPARSLYCQITDLRGQIFSGFQADLYERVLTLYIADLPAGLWLLRLQSENGEATVRKLIKQ